MSTYDFNDPTTSVQWVSVFLQGCYNDKQLLEQAVMSVTPQELSQVMKATPAQVLLYQALVSYWGEFKALPPPNAIAIAVSQLVGQLMAFTVEQRQGVLADAVTVFSSYMSQPMPATQVALVLAIVKHIYNKARMEPQLAQILHEGTMSPRVDEVLKKLTTLKQQTRTDKVPKNVFSLHKEGNLGEEFSTGLAWFDDLIGGGLRRGEAYSALAETGGGKTTLTAHMGCSLAAQGKRVLILVTEQSFAETSLRAKYWATVAKKNWKDFEAYTSVDDVPDELASPEIKQQILSLQKNIIAFDIDDINSIADVQDLVLQYKPDVFMLDWAGTLADRLMMDKDNPWNSDRALCLRAISNEVNVLSKAIGAAGIVYHQLAPNVGKNPFRDYDHTMAAECKSFSFNISFALVLAPRDKNDVMRISCTKSRLAGRRDCIVRLNGPLATFEPLTGYTKARGKNMWVSAKNADFATMPADKKANDGFVGS